MNVELKSPVDILQEFIVMHTTRIECANKILAIEKNNTLAIDAEKIVQQSTGFIEALMSELSNFGDAIKADVNKNTSYNMLYPELLTEFVSEDSTIWEDGFKKMEGILRNNYLDVINANRELPASIIQVLETQATSLG